MESGTDLYQRVPTVVLRPEAFGGMAFRGRSGTTLELDEEAYRLLVLLNQPLTVDEAARSLGVSDCMALESLVQELLALGFLQVFRVPSSNLQVPTWNLELGTWNRERGTTALPTDHLSAPESIHLALTHRCNLTCPCCYVGHDAAPEMTTAQVQALIDQAATGRVFQLALGGGEPLLRDDLIEIVAYAWQRGLVPNVTTNGTLLTPALIRELAPYVGQVQLSLNGPDAVTHERYRAHGSFRPAVEAMHLLQEGGVPFGVNTLVTRDNLPRLQQTIALAVERGARQITVLRPKPAPDAAWLPQVSPTPQEYRQLHSLLARAQLAYPQVLFNVDCALSFLMSDIAPARLRRGAVNGCAGGVRFLTVLPNGDAYPCSFLTSAGMRAGNLLTQGLDEVWHRAHVLVRWRQMDSRLQGHCRHCPTQAHCQGCRAIALTATGHLWAADPDCPRCQEGGWMRILSIRRGLEADHSSTHTEHIHGVTITESYDWWTCEFTLPYTAKLFQKLAEYEASGDCSLDFVHQGNQIVVSLTAILDYGAIAGDDAYIALANYCLDIKDDILAGDFSDLELLKAYVEGSKAEFKAMHSSSGIEHILEQI